MSSIGPNTIADLFFQLKWNSHDASHTEAYAGRNVNFWRDLLPRPLMDELWHKEPGEQLEMTFAPRELYCHDHTQSLQLISRRQFDPTAIGAPHSNPRVGRFYPRGLLKDIAGIFSANREPFRVASIENEQIAIDLNHPLADKALTLKVTVGAVTHKSEERGGTVQAWMENIARGAGMQARWQNHPTDYFSDNPFEKQDNLPDAIFYGKPRLVDHLDDSAIDIVRQLYTRFIKDSMRILDLMSSWHSHLPGDVRSLQVSGLGLNELELQQNKALSDYRVQDLNNDPALPYPDSHFDAVICTVSVEYLTDPMAIFAEVSRVLRSGGQLIVTFSNRWFAPKAIRIWSELHEFERMGLVLEYFRSTRKFQDLQTYSLRGLIRPRHDKYFGQQLFSDPVFAVWGTKV